MPAVIDYLLTFADAVVLFFRVVTEYLTMDLGEFVQWELWDNSLRTFVAPFTGLTWELRLFPDVVTWSLNPLFGWIGLLVMQLSDVLAFILNVCGVPADMPVYVGLLFLFAVITAFVWIGRIIALIIPNIPWEE